MKEKIAFINAVPYGSTGRIVNSIATVAENHNYDTFTYFSWTHVMPKSNTGKNVYVGSYLGKAFHIITSKILGLNGYFSFLDTMRLIKKLKEYKPNIIHLHVLHSWYINLPLLFRFIKNNNIPVVWTMHDCWAFTGQCTHFIVAKCDKWKNGCYSCPQYKEYPEAYVDQTKLMWNKKKKWFCKIENMTIVTPSKWLSGLVNQSFLKEYPVKVIHNGIDTSIFKPSKSNIIEKYNIPTNKIIILSVAYSWGYKKGLDILIALVKRLNSTKYHFIIVGTDKKIDEQLKYNNILSIHRTQNQKELVEIYSAADLFINPTLEDNYPTVNLESIACGTPVITFRTGGSPETIIDNMGCVVNYKDIDAMEKAITNYNIDVNRKQYIDFNKIDNSVRVLEYIDLYNNIVKSRGLNYG